MYSPNSLLDERVFKKMISLIFSNRIKKSKKKDDQKGID